jgi:hypothetical protein
MTVNMINTTPSTAHSKKFTSYGGAGATGSRREHFRI